MLLRYLNWGKEEASQVTSTEVSYYAFRKSDNLKLASEITNLPCCHALDSSLEIS